MWHKWTKSITVAGVCTVALTTVACGGGNSVEESTGSSDAPQFPAKAADPTFRTGRKVDDGVARPCDASDLTALLGPVDGGRTALYLTNSAGVSCSLAAGTAGVRLTGSGQTPLESSAPTEWSGALQPGAAIELNLTYDESCETPLWSAADITLPAFSAPVRVNGQPSVPVARCSTVELSAVTP